MTARRRIATVPVALGVLGVLGLALLALPVIGLLARVEWGSLATDLGSSAVLSALWLSVWTGIVATALSAATGIPLALLIHCVGPRLAVALRLAVTIPLILPPMVGGVALLSLLGRTSWLGGLLEDIGVRIPFTPLAVVLAETFVAMPFLVLAAEGALRSVDDEYLEAAATLGANSWQALRHVVIPLAAPGVLAGLTLCFARAVGEFGATALFAGNSPGVTQTMPLAIYTAFNGSGVTQGSALALALLLLFTAVGVILLARAWRPGSLR